MMRMITRQTRLLPTTTQPPHHKPLPLFTAQQAPVATRAVPRCKVVMSASAPEITSEINFYASWLCPYCQRVWMTLLEKGVPFKYVSIDLKNKPEWFLALNPAGSVPVVGYNDPDGTHIINESLTLLEFLEDYQPTPSMYPSHPARRAQARNIISFFGDKVIGPFNRTIRSPDKDTFLTASKELSTALTQLESKMSPEGPYFLGKDFSVVDAAVLPWLLRMFAIKHYRGLDALATVPKLKAYVEKCKGRGAVKGSMEVPTGPWEEGVIHHFAAGAGQPVDYTSA